MAIYYAPFPNPPCGANTTGLGGGRKVAVQRNGAVPVESVIATGKHEGAMAPHEQATDLQPADILTKGLSKLKFQVIRKQLCGWRSPSLG
jgi:hypothetical protein